MDRQPVLVALEGPLQGARYPVEADGLTLGREDACSVVIPDQNVSRFHARLVFHNAAIWVQDAGSRNGVFVNEKRVMRHKQLSPGDELTIGEHKFTLELDMIEVSEMSITGAALPIPTNTGKPSTLRIAIGAFVVGTALAIVLRWLG